MVIIDRDGRHWFDSVTDDVWEGRLVDHDRSLELTHLKSGEKHLVHVTTSLRTFKPLTGRSRRYDILLAAEAVLALLRKPPVVAAVRVPQPKADKAA